MTDQNSRTEQAETFDSQSLEYYLLIRVDLNPFWNKERHTKKGKLTIAGMPEITAF